MVVCFVLVISVFSFWHLSWCLCRLAFELVFDVWCYIVYYYYYTYTIIYYILYYILYIIIHILLYYYYYILYYTLPSSDLSSIPFPIIHVPLQSSHSKYTCRHLDILIYIPDSSPKYLTPHVLSEWMVEVCEF